MTTALAWTLTGIEITILIVGMLIAVGFGLYVGTTAWMRGEGCFAACRKTLWAWFVNVF